MSQAILAAAGAMCSVLALGALIQTHSGATQLASAQATTVSTPSTLSRSVPMPLAMPTVRAPARQYIPGPQQAQAQYQYAEPVMAQVSSSATPAWAVPMAALTAAAGLLALAFRTLSFRSYPPLSGMAMCAAAGANKKTPIVEITNDDIAQYLKDGYKLLDARPKYERERIYPKDSAHVEFVREANTSPLDPIAFIRKQSAAQYAGFFRDLERNPDPIKDADALFAKDDKVIVICGDGQRSSSLARILQWEGGYTNLVIVKRGLQTCTEDQLKELDTVGSNVTVGYKEAAFDRGGMLGVLAEGSQK